MRRNSQRIPAILTQAWAAVAFIGLAGAASGLGFEMREAVVATGYRQDNGSLSICSALSDPDFFGFGKMKYRQARIWEIGIGGIASVTDHVYARAGLAWGYILGGKVFDSGIADINSDPFNALVGHYYTSCCNLCECDDNDYCHCDCDSRIPAKLVPTTARLKGNTLDFEIALGYEFRPVKDFVIAPVVGYAYDLQRQKWDQAIWGPIMADTFPYPCLLNSESDDTITSHNYVLTITEDGETVTKYPVFTVLPSGVQVGDYVLTEDVGGPNCVAFGNCFDGTIYRAAWSGVFFGLDLGYAITDSWDISLNYAYHLSHYSGRFSTFGNGSGGDACSCELCPVFVEIAGQPSRLNQDSFGTIGFQPSTMTFNKWGWGQELGLGTQWRCGHWNVGICLGWQMRQANDCAESNPCMSCSEVVNPSMSTSSALIEPIWNEATMTRAFWTSYNALVTVGYNF